jgi:hypothetical protein
MKTDTKAHRSHDEALTCLLTDASAQKWLKAYLIAAISYYYRSMIQGKGPQVYIITGLQYLSVDETKTTRAEYTSLTAKGTVKDPTHHVPGKFGEVKITTGNDPHDGSTQEAKGYSGEYICAAQFRKLQLKFELDKPNFALPTNIPLAGLKDLRHGICGGPQESSSVGDEKIQYVGISCENESSKEWGSEDIADEYPVGTDPDDYGDIDWNKIRIKMGVLV